jgi:ribosome recycling factor
METLKKEIRTKMEQSFESLIRNFAKIRTGRANASVLDNITVDYYGQATPIKQLCNISIPEPRLIIIQPWDKTILGDVEKAIQASNVGVTPNNDGNVIRLPFQPLTEETRKEIVKSLRRMSEDAKIAIRHIRKEGNDKSKKMEKDGDITEDDLKKITKQIQEYTDDWIKKISDATKTKEKEIMAV